MVAHELKFGFEGRLHQQNYIQTNAPLGYFQFNNSGSSCVRLWTISRIAAEIPWPAF